jgi:nucleoside-diphosphate-sugar epimerase
LRILVTGSSGFIGANLVKELESLNYNITYLSSSNSKNKYVYFDLNKPLANKKFLIEFNPDIVIHLAWIGIPDYSQKNSLKNLNSSIEFLNIIIENTNCSKIIVTGSCWEYGTNNGVCSEDNLLNINSYFSWAKSSLYNYLYYKCSDAKISLIWFRLFYVYGPGQRSISLIQNLIESFKLKKTPNILYPNNRNDFVYVEDVVNVIINSLKINVPNGVYNIGSGNSFSVYDICLEVEHQLFNSNKISKMILENGDKSENVNFYANTKKTSKFLKLKCDTPLKKGIEHQIQHYLS